jgi:hypothetical protein
MRTLTTILALLLSLMVYSQRIVVPASSPYGFTNDCAIKALAGAKDITYKEAYLLLKDVYVEDKGVPTSDFIKLLSKEFPDAKLRTASLVKPYELIQLLEHNTYIVISKGHTFCIRYTSRWELIGYRSDLDKRVFIVIKLNK